MTPYARTVINQVAALRGVDPHDITRPNRTKKVYRARVEVAKLLYERGYSTPRIGTILNHDHTTIVFYLGRGKKKPAQPVWRTPRIKTLYLIKKTKQKPSPQRRLIRFAGFDPTDLQWITRPRQQEQRT